MDQQLVLERMEHAANLANKPRWRRVLALPSLWLYNFGASRKMGGLSLMSHIKFTNQWMPVLWGWMGVEHKKIKELSCAKDDSGLD